MSRLWNIHIYSLFFNPRVWYFCFWVGIEISVAKTKKQNKVLKHHILNAQETVLIFTPLKENEFLLKKGKYKKVTIGFVNVCLNCETYISIVYFFNSWQYPGRWFKTWTKPGGWMLQHNWKLNGFSILLFFLPKHFYSF